MTGSEGPEASVAIGPEQIAAIWERHGLGTPQRVTRLGAGVVNEGYAVDATRVVRFNRRDPHLAKFANEAAACRWLAGRGLPVPEVVALDTDRREVPCDLLITTLLPGSNGEEDWSGLGAAARAERSRAAGRQLARLHELPGPFFGHARELADAPTARTWPEFLSSVCEGYARSALEAGALAEPVIDRIRRGLEDLAGPLGDVQRPSLVHRDYHFGNLLWCGAELTGMVDFEWSYFGDPEMDLSLLDTLVLEFEGFRAKPFLEGYVEARPLSAEFDAKQRIYRTLRGLELSSVAARHWSGGERRALHARLDADLGL